MRPRGFSHESPRDKSNHGSRGIRCQASAAVTPSVTERAYYELIERVATVDAIGSGARRSLLSLQGVVVGEIEPATLFPESPEPLRYRYARSNGVAIHRTFSRAALRARWELAERDRVLRSWRGEIRPNRIAIDLENTLLRHSTSYDWQAHHFGRAPFAPEADVVGVIGFPRNENEPLAMGFAARAGADDALDAAIAEALQSLSFLWGEAVATTPPTGGPTAMHHLELFQYRPHHEHLRRWLDGGHHRSSAGAQMTSEVNYVSLSPTWLPRDLVVVKAVCRDALSLAFGDVPFLESPLSPLSHPIA